jgi:hypothetical protein
MLVFTYKTIRCHNLGDHDLNFLRSQSSVQRSPIYYKLQRLYRTICPASLPLAIRKFHSNCLQCGLPASRIWSWYPVFQRLSPPALSAIDVTNAVSTHQIMLLLTQCILPKEKWGRVRQPDTTTNHVACHWSFISIYLMVSLT